MKYRYEINQVEDLIKKLGSTCRDTQNDYVFLGRAPDVINFTDNELHTFECKLKNWKQAIKQAYDHSLIADYSWVVIPNPKAIWVKDTTLGLMDGETFEIIVPAQKNDFIKIYHDKIIKKYY